MVVTVLCSLTAVFYFGIDMTVHRCQALQNGACHRFMTSAPMYWRYGVADNRLGDRPHKIEGSPPVLQGLLDAPPMQSWHLPTLYKAPLDHSGDDRPQPMPPVFVMLHIFSKASAGFERRRDFIRAHSPLQAIPPAYHHLIELKFVLGRSVQASVEASIDEEQEMHGDLIRLDDLVDGDNMNDGKSFQWIRWVGREGGREAWWVL